MVDSPTSNSQGARETKSAAIVAGLEMMICSMVSSQRRSSWSEPDTTGMPGVREAACPKDSCRPCAEAARERFSASS